VDIPNQPSDITGNPIRGGSLVATAGSYSPFCKVVTDWKNLADFRFRGSVPLPWGFNTSFIYRDTPGAPIDATLAVTSANVRFKNPARTTLTAAQTVNLYAPNSVFGDRFRQLDLAVSKSLSVGFSRLLVSVDLYNALNSNSIQSVISAFGARWQRPVTFLEARLLRVSGRFDF
jgi:hypothetical protein